MPFVDSCKDLGISVDTELKFHGHIRSIVGKSSGMSVNLLNSTLCRSREFILSRYISHVRPLLQFDSCVWNLKYIYISDMILVRRVALAFVDSWKDLGILADTELKFPGHIS